MCEKLISYKYKGDDSCRFIQYKKDPLPDWATDVKDYNEPETTPG